MKHVPATVGERFHRLIVMESLGVQPVGTGSQRKALARCKCECGKVVDVILSNLRNGNTKSCGCFNMDSIISRATSHGLSNHPLYAVHDNMKARTTRPSQINYDRYGGRGIRICEDWLDFEVFYQWAISNGWRKELQIDRIDNDGDYEPSNCRFVSCRENVINRSTSKIWVINGNEYDSLASASRSLGRPTSTISNWCLGYKSNGKQHPPRKGCYSLKKYSTQERAS